MGNLDGRCWRLHWPGTSISNTRLSEALPLLDMLFPHQSLNEAYEVHPILATVHPFQDQTIKAFIPTTLIHLPTVASGLREYKVSFHSVRLLQSIDQQT